MVTAGIAGLGWWGQNLVRAVQGTGVPIAFAAGAVRHPDKVADFAAEQGLALYDSLEAMLAHPGLDAVVLATPHSAHADQMVAVAEAGKHVYCEKPFTLHKADAERAIAAADAAGVKIVVGHNRRFVPAMAALRQRIADGSLGTLLHVEMTESVPAALILPAGNWRFSRDEWPAGGMTPMGVHLIDNMVDLFGPVERVTAQAVRRAAEPDIDDTTSVLLRFASGMTGYLATMVTARAEMNAAIFGSAATARIVGRGYDTVTVAPVEGEVETLTFDYGRDTDALRAELVAFADDIEGRAPYPIPHDQIVHVVAVLEAIIRSAGTGNPEPVG